MTSACGAGPRPAVSAAGAPTPRLRVHGGAGPQGAAGRCESGGSTLPSPGVPVQRPSPDPAKRSQVPNPHTLHSACRCLKPPRFEESYGQQVTGTNAGGKQAEGTEGPGNMRVRKVEETLQKWKTRA